MGNQTGIATTATRDAAVQLASNSSGGVGAHEAGDYWQHNQTNYTYSAWSIPSANSPSDVTHAAHTIANTWRLRLLVTVGTVDYAIEIPAFGPNAPVFIGNGSWSGSPSATAPTFVVQPSSLSLPEGAQASISATADGTPPIIYRWTLNDLPVVGANTNTLFFSNFTASQAGDYVCIATNANGQAVSTIATVSLQTTTGESVPTRPI